MLDLVHDFFLTSPSRYNNLLTEISDNGTDQNSVERFFFTHIIDNVIENSREIATPRAQYGNLHELYREVNSFESLTKLNTSLRRELIEKILIKLEYFTLIDFIALYFKSTDSSSSDLNVFFHCELTYNRSNS